MVLVAIIEVKDSLVLLVKVLTVVERVDVFRRVCVQWNPNLVFIL